MWWFLFGIPMLGRQKWACPWPQWPDSLDCLVDLCWFSSVWVFVYACACVGVPAPIRVEARGWCLAFSCIAVGFVLSNRKSHWTWSLALLSGYLASDHLGSSGVCFVRSVPSSFMGGLFSSSHACGSSTLLSLLCWLIHIWKINVKTRCLSD